MGYTPGSALGKEGSGRVEPVGLDIRRSRAGIGREDPLKEKRKREEIEFERKKKNEEALMAEFGSWQKSQWRSRRVVVNYKKAKAALDQLENKEVVVPKKNEEEEEGGQDEEEEEEVTEELAALEYPQSTWAALVLVIVAFSCGYKVHVVILKVAELVVLGVLVLDKVLLSKNIERMVVWTAVATRTLALFLFEISIAKSLFKKLEFVNLAFLVDLQDIVMKLRDEYQYCPFCGFQYESMEALLSSCPGTNEDDH
ncbi:hypothetical protein Goarm_014699 [Gossypium armourianum]|uniref:G-patch domain-containing protein n=1 Tax=Gossypium armourianum TaxID=34283 RepID=A0A7J9J9N8_9ROSI|nr:hypothetical protein [Gossypium armourianum]